VSLNRAFLLISGNNYRALIALCRRLTRRGIPFYVIARSATDQLYRTQYRKQIRATLDEVELSVAVLTNVIAAITREHTIDELIILPTAEHLNRFLLDNRPALEAPGRFVIPLVDANIYRRISDKASFAALCRSRNIPLPANVDPTTTPFPLAAKPRSEFSVIDGTALTPRLIYSAEDWSSFTTQQHHEDYYFQEYIPGKSFYLLFYFYRDGTYKFATQQNGAQQPDGKSIVLAWTSAFQDIPTKDRFVDLFRDLGFHGALMIELKEYNGNIYIIEANPRLWGPSQLLLDSGANLIDGYIDEYISGPREKHPPSYQLGTIYFWFNGFMSALMSSKGINWFEDGRTFFLRHFFQILSSDVYLRSDSWGLFACEFANSFVTGLRGYVARFKNALLRTLTLEEQR